MNNKFKEIKNGYVTEARKMTRGKFWLWFARIATVIGLLTGGLALHDYLTEDEFIIEQRMSPEAMDSIRERLDRGEEVILEKGIRRNDDDTGS